MSSNNEKRKVLKSEPVDIKTKLKIMKEFKETTKKEITGNTVYKGFNIGIWQLNLRNKYLHGKLNIFQFYLSCIAHKHLNYHIFQIYF